MSVGRSVRLLMERIGGGGCAGTAAAADVVMEMAVVCIRVHVYIHSIRLSSNWCIHCD